MAIRWPLLIRRVHKWLALLVGVQVVLWTVTGFYMVAVHIDFIHGDHLVRSEPREPYDLQTVTSPASILAAVPEAQELKLRRFLGQPVWLVQTGTGQLLIDAVTGQRLANPTEAQIREAATRLYAGEPQIVSAKLLTEAPLEMQTREPPFWQVEFEGWNRPTFYLSSTTGELISRRHNFWRIFDVAWMLHIMDYEERSNVNNPLLRVATWSAVLMALSGAWLLFWSFPRKKRKKA